jgi:DivIVA domain-containing protein
MARTAATGRHSKEDVAMGRLTADDVTNTKFQPTKFREGYDQDEVDDFLDEVVAVLRRHEAGEPIDAHAAAEMCRSALFQPTKFREGYNQDEVDDLLDRLVQGFDELARGGYAPPSSPAGGHAPASSAAGGDRHRPVARPARPEDQVISYGRRSSLGTVVAVVAAIGALALLVGLLVL